VGLVSIDVGLVSICKHHPAPRCQSIMTVE
jgi:hypothetical protein